MVCLWHNGMGNNQNLGQHDALAPEEVEVQVGQIMLLVEHLPHQGASWEGPGDNIRLHTYLSPWSCFRLKQRKVILPVCINRICGITGTDKLPPVAERETRGRHQAQQSSLLAMTATHLLAKNDTNWTKYTSRQRQNKKLRWNSANLAGGARQGAAAGGAPKGAADQQDEDPETSEKE